MEVKCYCCDTGLEEPGGLVFHKPYQEEGEDVSIKRHLCSECDTALSRLFAAVREGHDDVEVVRIAYLGYTKLGTS